MNLPSILLLIAVIVAVIASLRFLLRQRKRAVLAALAVTVQPAPRKTISLLTPLTGIVRGVATTHQEPLEETGLFSTNCCNLSIYVVQ